ncbi:MAG: ABC transporter permease subunit [Acidimicrobiia bacterium]|nr:ABC transporter permease subunit [Acidimicrobiia bacterium]
MTSYLTTLGRTIRHRLTRATRGPAPSVFEDEFEQPRSSRSEKWRSALSEVAVAILLLVIVAVLWEIIKLVTGTDSIKMPHVWDIVVFFGSETSQGENFTVFLLRNVWSTGKGAAIGLGVGATCGLITGIVISRSRLIASGLMPLIVAAQAVPIVAVAPALVLWLGTGGTTKAMIAAYLTYFPITVATARGIQAVPADSRDLLRTYGASNRTILTTLEVPFALPLMFVGLETAAAMSVVGAIVAELPFGSKDGLGVVILTSWQFFIFEPRALYAAAIGACALGAVFVLLIRGIGFFALGHRRQGEVL